MPDDREMLEGDALEDDALEGDALEDDALEGDASADAEERRYETPDRGYELDLDKHSPSDLDAAIQDAVEAVERAGHAGVGAPDAGGNGEVGAGGDGSAGEGGPAELEAATLQERLLRTLADFDNYRKRTEREKKSLRRLGILDVMRDALSISDNLERALESSGGIEDLKQGVQMILRQHEEFLRRHGVEQFESVGQRFDPAVHEAVATRPSSEVGEPTVSEELQRGYRFHDQLLRPAMVYVAMPDSGKAEEAEEAEGVEGAEGAGQVRGEEASGLGEEVDRAVD